MCIPRYALRLLFVKESYKGALMEHFSREQTYESLCTHFYWPHVLNGWEDDLNYVELAYSRIVYPSTNNSRCECVYCLNPLILLDLKPFPMGGASRI